MSPKVSVIIAVYNCEKYIGECARSLFEQTLDDVEYVFVNDASVDNSMAVLDSVIQLYPKRKPHVKIINLKENGGVANARSLGLSNVTGNYVIHTDSDDWIDTNMLEVMYETAQNNHADIVGCNFIHEYTDRQVVSRQTYESDMEGNIRNLLSGKIFPSLCTSLTRRSLITDNDITFPKGLNMGEDLYFNLQLYLSARKIIGLEIAPYHYRHTEDSSCVQHTWESVDSDIQIARMLETIMRDKHLYDHYADEIEYRKLYSKMPLIIYFDRYDNYRKWLKIFPETHSRIMRYNQFNIVLRIELWLAAHHMFYLSKAIRHIVLWRHHAKSLIGGTK